MPKQECNVLTYIHHNAFGKQRSGYFVLPKQFQGLTFFEKFRIQISKSEDGFSISFTESKIVETAIESDLMDRTDSTEFVVHQRNAA